MEVETRVFMLATKSFQLRFFKKRRRLLALARIFKNVFRSVVGILEGSEYIFASWMTDANSVDHQKTGRFLELGNTYGTA